MIQKRHIAIACKAIFILLSVTAATSLSALLLSGGKMLSVQSGSMAPAIPKGSLVIVNRVPALDIAAGDVITYTSDDKTATITHRVVTRLENDLSGNSFVTKGDANNDADTPIESARIVGRVERTLPYLGYGIDFLKKPIGLIAFIYLPALIVIYNESRKLARYYKRMQPYSFYKPRPHGIPSASAYLVIGSLFIGFASFGTATAFAELQHRAVLTGNTITSANREEPEPEPEPEQPDTTVTCTNNTNVTVNQTTNQQATSGDATVEGNTTGGSATSGNASNSSSSSTNISINNGSCTVPAQP